MKPVTYAFEELPIHLQRQALNQERMRLQSFHQELIAILFKHRLTAEGLPADSFYVGLGDCGLIIQIHNDLADNDIIKVLLQEGQAEYAYQTSREIIIESINAEGFRYLKNGTRIDAT